jgi:hypothetical protein
MSSFRVLLLTFGIGAAVLGCSTPSKHVSADPTRDVLLFPYGNYIHQVKLFLPGVPDPSKRNFEFRGAVKIAAETIHTVVLSPIGTTILTLTEDRATGKVDIKVFVDSLKTYAGNLTEYYASLRVILTMLRHPVGNDVTLDAHGRPVRMKKTVGDRPTQFFFAGYDEHEIPTSLHIENEKFTVDVKVAGYEI